MIDETDERQPDLRIAGLSPPPAPEALPRSEYPRPQFRRASWLCLNGVWQFEFDDDDVGLAHDWTRRTSLDGRIVVPFPHQAPLSGVGDRSAHPVVWYRREFALPVDWRHERLLLHFGAVDFHADVWLNGQMLGSHDGGYTPFTFDITATALPGVNALVVRCVDLPSEEQPRGKQDREAHQPYRFAATTGIWQTVWIEPVRATYIRRCRIVADLAAGAFRLTPETSGRTIGLRIEARAFCDGRLAGTVSAAAGEAGILLHLTELRKWTPHQPHLYDVQLVLRDQDQILDEVTCYAGLREIAVRGRRVLLNGDPIYQRQVLDQGYWPSGAYAAPSDEALRLDVEWIKRLGFNGVRKHQKVEDPRWLHWCDRLGVLVWEEMAAFFADSPRSRAWLRQEWRDVVRRDVNHPSIVAWVPFNESFGLRDLDRNVDAQAYVAAVVADTRRLDATRPVVDNSGWSHVDTDIADTHNYDPAGEIFLRSWQAFHEGHGPERDRVLRSWNGHHQGRAWYGPGYPKNLFVPGRTYGGQPIAVTEWGGFFLAGAGEVAPVLRQRRGVEADEASFLARHRDMIEAFDSLPDLAGDCWTQLTDIEDEPNGLLTEDRRPKIDADQIRAVNTARDTRSAASRR
jgi:hypothetical protein